ncbi:MAG TPA: family 16 glycosylhydrolase [Sphingomonas sp.]|jgi:hypothetical protein|uniref:glycoside hydrolase family 16 protein n=1 Tax=Sphingomonas sp. TaxID=28214 RepID=UPI002ED91B44
MTRFLLPSCLLVAAGCAQAQTVLWQDHFDKRIAGRWKADAERFSGVPSDETRAGNGESQRYDPGQIRIAKGLLQIDGRMMTEGERRRWAERVRDPKFKYAGSNLRNMLQIDRVSGQITTFPATPFAPGTRLSARVKLPVAAAAWPAVWGYDYVNHTEIDVFEGSGRAGSDPQGNVSQAMHDGESKVNSGCPKVAIPTEGWHEFYADWRDPKKIVFGYDGRVNCTVATTPRMTKPMVIMIGMAIGSSGWPWIGQPAPGDAKPRFLVDWVKVER